MTTNSRNGEVSRSGNKPSNYHSAYSLFISEMKPEMRQKKNTVLNLDGIPTNELSLLAQQGQ